MHDASASTNISSPAHAAGCPVCRHIAAGEPAVIGPYSFDAFVEAARAFHGYPAPGLLLGGYMVQMALDNLPENGPAGGLYDAVSETAWCLPDAVQMLTPCSIGNGWLRIVPLGLYAVSLYDKRSGEGVRVYLDAAKLERTPEVATWFFKSKPKPEQDSVKLRWEIKHFGPELLGVEPVRVRPDFMARRGKGPVRPCPSCGQGYPSAHGPICRACQGDGPYEGRLHGLHDVPQATGRNVVALPVEQAVGKPALHDMTRIIPGQEKDPLVRRGQVIEPGDVCRLQHMGRAHVYVAEDGGSDAPAGMVHEDTAARDFAMAMAGDGVIQAGEPKEGKAGLVAAHDGVLLVDEERLRAFNLVPQVMAAGRRPYAVVREGARIAATRAIPLFLPRELHGLAMSTLEADPLFSVRPMAKLKVGILVTGTEVAAGLIEDRFEEVVRGKVQAFGCPVAATRIVPDDRERIGAAVGELIAAGAQLIVTTAGLSVDPDDVTRQGLLDAGVTDLLHGMPVLPGAMTLLARLGDVAVIGVPACALFFKTTALDLLLPRVLAGVRITRGDLARMGAGGMCMECRTCTYPKCPLG